MISYEQKKCSGILLCASSTICGQMPTLEDDMYAFQEKNVGILNTGWLPMGENNGIFEYQFVNVENITSSTLDIKREKNTIIINLPNENND